MDQTLPNTPNQPTKQQLPPQVAALLPKLKNKKFLKITGLILFLLIVIPVITFSLSGNKPQNMSENGASVTPEKQTDKTATKAANPTANIKKQPSSTVVYGSWTSQTSVIRAVDVGSSETTTVATLPLSIKKVSVLSNKTLLYIDQTDQSDYGKRISIYDFQKKQIIANVPADSGYSIDTYLLSPNKKYLIVWEVSLSPETRRLQGGHAKMYSVDLATPTVKKLLYDEAITQTTPVHYPVAVLDSGTVFTDKFIPNDAKGGAGWAYGMSTVDFDGTNKRDIEEMQAGTYSIRPVLSPGGKYLLFSGYDGSLGDGNAVKEGYRQALLTPNTVELLNTESMQRNKLPNLPTANSYSSVQWDQQGNVIITIIAQDTKKMGIYSYDLATLQATQFNLPEANGTPYHYVAQLPASKTLVGLQSTDNANLGNLGETYTYTFTQLAILDASDSLSYLSLQDPFIQYITVLPANYFRNVLGVQTQKEKQLLQITPPPQKKADRYASIYKTKLSTLRAKSQSEPVLPATASAKKIPTKHFNETSTCKKLLVAQCAARGIKADSKAFLACRDKTNTNDQLARECY